MNLQAVKDKLEELNKAIKALETPIPKVIKMAKQKILRMATLDQSLRASVDSWDGEDGELIKEIGLSSSPRFPFYQTPMHAIGDGWRLIAPPVLIKGYCNNIDAYEWWFEK